MDTQQVINQPVDWQKLDIRFFQPPTPVSKKLNDLRIFDLAKLSSELERTNEKTREWFNDLNAYLSPSEGFDYLKFYQSLDEGGFQYLFLHCPEFDEFCENKGSIAITRSNFGTASVWLNKQGIVTVGQLNQRLKHGEPNDEGLGPTKKHKSSTEFSVCFATKA